MAKTYLFRVLGMVIFMIGIILGVLLFGGVTWANLEAAFYGFEDLGGGRLSTVECPSLLTTSDTGSVGAIFSNPNNFPIQFMVRADISSPIIRTEEEMLSLNAHQSKKVNWQVTSQDKDMRYFIFAQISNYPAAKITFRQSTCGILVLNIPQFSGKLVFTALFIVILVGIIGGVGLWEVYGHPATGKIQEITRGMKTLGVIVLLGMLVSFQGAWIFGVVLFAGSVLALGVIVGFLLA